MATLIGVKGLDKTTGGFRRALYEGARARGLDPDHLATVMSFESGFNPGAKNPHSGALGLIQWVSDSSFAATARKAGMPGVTRADLPRMTAEQQLPLVFAWYDGKGVKASSPLDDYYLAVFMPALVGKPSTHVAAREPSLAYSQNAGFDRDGKGYYTVGDIARSIQSVLAQGLRNPRVDVPGGSVAFGPLSPLALGLGVAVAAWFVLPKVRLARRTLGLAA